MKYRAPLDKDNLASIMSHLTAWGVDIVGLTKDAEGYELEFDKPLDPDQLEHFGLKVV